MKRFLLYLLAIATLVACTKGDDGESPNPEPTPEKPKAEIEIETTVLDFTAEGGENIFSFTTTEAWTAEVINSRADGWCSISPTSGAAGSATITVTTEPNDTPDDRSASIVIKAGSASKTISVSQKQKDALTVTASKFEVGAEGGEVKIEVKANIDFEYAIDESAQEWIKYEGTRAIKTSTLTFSVAENDDTERREGKIAIKSGEFNEVVTIYQAGSEPSIVISQNEYVVSSDGETISVEVSSNVDVEVEMPADADWISENTTRATSTNTYRFDIQPNEDYDQRTAEIKFINKENNLSEVVKITQTQKDALVVAKDSYTVDSDGDQIEIEVGHNVDFDVEISTDWITQEQTRAFTTETLVFNVAKNPTNDNREGTITFKSKDGALSQTVKVYQAQEDALIISKKDIMVNSESGTLSFEIQTNVDFTVSNPNVSWLRAVQTRGLTSYTLHYEYDANTTHDSREAQIIVTDTRNNKSETITITQAQKDALVVAKDSYTVDSDGDQIEIEVGHNVDFDVEISTDWITQEQTRAFTTETLVFNVAKNPTNDNREGTITFKSKDGALSQTVKVYQAQDDVLIISKKDIMVNSESGTLSFEIQTNVDFTVSNPNVSWLRAVQTRGLTSHTLHYEYDANTTYDSREAQIIVTNTRNNKSETITITQAQKDAIVLAKTEYEFGSEGGELDFEIQTNVDVTVNISSGARSWIEHISTRALESKTLHFNVAACADDENREGTITISGGNATQTITVKQSGRIPDNEIWYTSSDGKVVDRFGIDRFGANIVSNTYENGKGVSKFDGPVTSIGDWAFADCSSLTEITIPNSVTSIGARAFDGCSSLTNVSIGNSVTSIEGLAFAGCSSLQKFYGKFAEDNGRCLIKDGVLIAYAEASGTEYTIPNSVTSIGSYAFYGCSSLTEITIPNSVTSIGYVAFFNCSSLTEITIPNSVTSIGNYAFYDCSRLTEITIPNSVTSIGWGAFQNCSSLTEITIPNSVTSIGKYAFQSCSSLTEITIPNSVTSIGESAFDNCRSLTEITIPNRVTSIGDWAFYRCSSLTEITIPNRVTSIGSYAFYRCSSLQNIICEPTTPPTGGSEMFDGIHASAKIYVPAGSGEAYKTAQYWRDYASRIEEMGIPDNEIWYTSSDGEVVEPDRIDGFGANIVSNTYDYENGKGVIKFDGPVTSIGYLAFGNCSRLTEITIPNSVTSIGDYAFDDCSRLTEITIPNSVTSIRVRAFYYCSSLTEITIPNSVTSIGWGAFQGCSSLTEITIPNSVTSIGELAFANCRSLTEITIPNSVTSIGVRAFADCSSLTEITIPNSVTSIGEYAFEGCSKLQNIICEPTTPPTGGSEMFDGIHSSAKIYVPAGSGEAYKTAQYWRGYASRIEEMGIPDNEIWYTSSDGKVVEPSPGTVFGANIVSNTYDYENGKGVIKFDGPVTSIGYMAFYKCSSLTEITIPNSVTSIGEEAFEGCSSLTEITIPNSVTSIGARAFRYCSSLTEITIPNSVTSIGRSAFNSCSSLQKFYGKFAEDNGRCLIKDGVLIAYAEASGTEYTIPNSVTSIGSSAFEYCSSLTEITIPNSVTSIGDWAFDNCSSLTKITIPNSVTSIREGAFAWCDSLTEITIPNSVTSIGSSAFHECSSLTEITIPNSVTSIGDNAFNSCSSLTEITIPNSVTSIGKSAFIGCGSLTEITIPNSVTSIGSHTFAYCSSLKSVYCRPATPPTIGSYAFLNNASGRKIHVPEESFYIYRSAWSDYSRNIVSYKFD